MLQVSNIRAHKEAYIQAFKKRNFDAENILNDVLKLDETRRSTQAQLDETLAESNQLSKEIGTMFKNGEHQKAGILKGKSAKLKETSKAFSDELNNTIQELDKLLYTIPNVPHDSVPSGSTEDDNVEIFKEGDIPVLPEGSCLLYTSPSPRDGL